MEILNTIQGASDGVGILFSMIFMLFAIILLVIAIYLLAEKEMGAMVICSFFALIVGAVGIGVFTETKQKSPDLYEVRITDFNEVYRNGYEIVEQRGEIYTVKKREASE